jgi:hypothetical protein
MSFSNIYFSELIYKEEMERGNRVQWLHFATHPHSTATFPAMISKQRLDWSEMTAVDIFPAE